MPQVNMQKRQHTATYTAIHTATHRNTLQHTFPQTQVRIVTRRYHTACTFAHIKYLNPIFSENLQIPAKEAYIPAKEDNIPIKEPYNSAR